MAASNPMPPRRHAMERFGEPGGAPAQRNRQCGTTGHCLLYRKSLYMCNLVLPSHTLPLCPCTPSRNPPLPTTRSPVSPLQAGASDSESHLPLSSRSALSWHDRCVREAMALLRASLRARRNSNWRAPRPRNRRPTPGSGLAGHVSYTAWRAYGLLSVMLWGLFMVPLRLVDTVRVAGVWLVHLARGAAGM